MAGLRPHVSLCFIDLYFRVYARSGRKFPLPLMRVGKPQQPKARTLHLKGFKKNEDWSSAHFMTKARSANSVAFRTPQLLKAVMPSTAKVQADVP